MCCLPIQSDIRFQMCPTNISQSSLQASILQEGLRFCAAVKNFSCSQVVDTEEETAVSLEKIQNEGEEEPPAPAIPGQLKTRGKKRLR